MDSEWLFEKAARPFGLAAAAVLVFMMLLTTVSVVVRQLFGLSMYGTVELAELALVLLIFLALPGVFMRDEHIVVDLIDHLVPKRLTRALHLIGLAITLVFLIVTLYTMIDPFLYAIERPRHTMTMQIDRVYHWLPILFGFAGAIIATVWLLVHLARGGERPLSPPPAE